MIENIVIGETLTSPECLFSYNQKDWKENELEKTLWTNERWLPRILVMANIVKSTSEVRRNRKDLCVELNDIDFKVVKYGKKFLFIAVGKNNVTNI